MLEDIFRKSKQDLLYEKTVLWKSEQKDIKSNFDKSKRKAWEQILNESLILAQDERWQRA